jgi:hypothetical protein
VPAGPNLALAALVSWLLTEAVGAFMVRSWIRSRTARSARGLQAARAQRPPHPARTAEPEEVSLPVLAGHAGLNLAGLLCWIVFVAFGTRAAGWLAVVFMAPAIGLGISTVTIWTPYPAARSRPDPPRSGEPREPGVLSDSDLERALGDDELSRRLVDDLLRINLAQSPAMARQWNLRPLIPLAHGVLAIATFLLAVLAVIAAL